MALKRAAKDNINIGAIIIAVVLVVVVVIAITFIVKGCDSNNSNKTKETTVSENTENIEETQDPLWGDGVETEIVKTQVIDVEYPVNILTAENVEDDMGYHLDFYGKGSLEDYCAFTIYFGEPCENSTEIGSLNGTKVYFFVNTDYSGYEEYMEDIYPLQESVNNIIWQIQQSEDFVKPQ